jgi:hypothetical protein
MFARGAFVAAFVVSGEACHQLLGVCVVAKLDFRDEVGGICAAQRGGEFAVMEHLNFAGFARPVAEAEIAVVVHGSLRVDAESRNLTGGGARPRGSTRLARLNFDGVLSLFVVGLESIDQLHRNVDAFRLRVFC